MAAIVSFAGDGTKENPMTVADVLAASMDESTVWVKAYIVGNINGSKMENIQFTAEGASATNIALADAQNETNVANCIPVQLPTGDIRAAINLKDNPGNLGKELLIQAQLIKYFGQNGLKNAAAFELSGEGVEPGPQPGSNDFEAALTDNQGAWTFVDKILPEGLSYVWAQSSSYGMKASAYANGTKYVTESYLVSPALILGENSVLTFDHVQRYAAEDPATQLTLLIRGDKPDSWQYQLPIPNYSDGSSWTFVSSGDIDLSAYAGKTIQLWFRYTSDENFAATWEIKNVKVTNAKTAEDGPVLKDISNTPQTAYTIAQAVEIIQNHEGNDMSKEVYTKGIIREIKSLNTAQYQRAQYWIGDDTTEDLIQVYNGYYIGGADFTADDQIKVGDEVIVCGRLTLYNTTYEIDANNFIYSLNGKTTIDDNPDPQPGVVTKTIAEVQAGENGKVKVEGTVVAVCARGAVIGDATGYIYVYDQNFASEVGDQVTVEGTTSTYGGFKQFSASAGYELTKTGTTTVSYPEPVVMDGAAMDAWIAAPAIQYVQYTGTLSISGNYYNVSVEGAETAQGSLVYLPEALKEGLADGDAITVTGFAMYISGSKYVNTVVTGISKGLGVEEIQGNGSEADGPVYDLSGRRVENPVKGLYIKNGKKMVIK